MFISEVIVTHQARVMSYIQSSLTWEMVGMPNSPPGLHSLVSLHDKERAKSPPLLTECPLLS